jgi:hypothetical protein
MTLLPGRNALLFEPDGKPVVANRVLGTGDPRALSVAVWSWNWLTQ